MIYYSAPQILAASDSTGKFVKKQTPSMEFLTCKFWVGSREFALLMFPSEANVGGPGTVLWRALIY